MMYRPTISIRAMMAIVAFIALACVALARANAVWASLTFTAALAVISFAVLAAIFRRRATQAFWIGFALFGWLYLWMAHWPNGDFRSMPDQHWILQSDSGDALASTRWLVYAYNNWLPRIRSAPPAFTVVDGGSSNGGSSKLVAVGPPPDSYPLHHEFTRVGHSLFIVIVAVAGGSIAKYLYKTRDEFERKQGVG